MYVHMSTRKYKIIENSSKFRRLNKIPMDESKNKTIISNNDEEIFMKSKKIAGDY